MGRHHRAGAEKDPQTAAGGLSYYDRLGGVALGAGALLVWCGLGLSSYGLLWVGLLGLTLGTVLVVLG